MKKYKIGDTAYMMNNNRIVRGTIQGVLKFDDTHIKYYFETARSALWVTDLLLYETIDELIDDLKSCVMV